MKTFYTLLATALVTCQSIFLFAQSGTITVSTPNGGQSWTAGTQQYIYWSSSNVTNVRIDYSTDNGGSWSNIISSTTASSGYYYWTVPNTSSTLCKVKVSDASAPNVYDVSDNVFSIVSPSITLTSPNGGEVWTAQSYQYIYWYSQGSSYFTVEYSSDNGSTWNTLTSGISGNYYYWNVSNTPSASCKVRVKDYYNTSVSDISDNVFTITAPVPYVTVNTPNGGQTWTAGSSQYIYWDSQNITDVKIEYSTNNGVAWSTVVASTTASNGSYQWTLPTVSSTLCKIKISDASNQNIYDLSDNVFTIVTPFINVYFPNGGEDLQAGNSQYIYWNSGGLSSYVLLEYSVDNGLTWTQICNGCSNSGTYNWSVPNNPSTQCLIRVSDYYNNALNDVSDATFTILPATPGFTIISPNGGEKVVTGSSYWIEYSYTNSTNVKIEYSTDNGSTWNTIIASTPASSNYNWNPVPNTPSTQCLVKVSDVSQPTAFDISNANFTITDPYIMVTEPNGGESYIVGNNQYVYWDYAGTSSWVTLEYSTDGGLNYNVIVAGTSNSGSYYWSVPNTPSTTCKFRVTDYYTASIFDASNNNFTIAASGLPTVKITTPNGGEVWTAGSSQYIYWNSSNATTLDLYYSTDNGFTWNLIASGQTASNGYYYWNPITSTPSTQCRIKAVEPGTGYYDVSNNIFSIINPSITLTEPNGGETWTSGTNQYIYWNAAGLSSWIKIYYSFDNGSTWTYWSYVSNTGSYNFPVPTVTSLQDLCLIRLEDYSTSTYFDISDNVFTIVPAPPVLYITTPNGSQQWAVGTSQYIYWTSANIGNLTLEYSIDNGMSWDTITASTPANWGYYYWTIPNTPSTQCKIGASDATNPAVNSVSPGTFTIASPSIIVTSPNSGEKLTGLQYYYIYYQGFGLSSYINVDYSTNGGMSWTDVCNGCSNNGYYYWYVPNNPSTTCKVRVTDYYDTTIADASDGLFTILAPTPTVTVSTPNGGEQWAVGSSQYIYWSSQYVNNVKLEYSTNNGGTWSTIIASTPASNGYYYWPVPNFPSSLCKIKISDASNPLVFDISNNVFKIVTPSITVTTPNGGEQWQGANSYYIYWSSSGISSYVNLEYTLDNGITWTTIVNGTWNYGYYYWTVPNTGSTQCKIRITDYNNSSVFDVSDNVFTIVTTTPTLTLNSPNGGEVWGVGNSYYISWSSYLVTNVKIEYSSDFGTNWSVINASYPANNAYYSWTIPNTPSMECLVRVTDASVPAVTDQSNSAFTIVTPSIMVDYPDGGEQFTATNSYNVNWVSQGISNYVNLYYSTDNGATWSWIVNGTYNDGDYSWYVPNTPSMQCKVKATDYYNSNISDVSNSTFTILPAPPAVTVTSPDGGEVWAVGTTKYIYWNSANVNFVKLEYSVNGGSSYNTIIGSTSASTGSYLWPVPNMPSVNCYIRISDATNPAVNDISNDAFSIVVPNITVTAPNGGESWTGLTYNYITWTSSGASGYVTIEYSTNSGSSWTTVSSYAYNSGYYNWLVPNTPSSNCLVRVKDYNNPALVDVSNSTFTITTAPSSVVLYDPDGGEVWGVGSTQYISWTSSNVTNVKLEYSADNGSTWNTIIASTAASTGYYSWPVPNDPSTFCLVQISDAANAATNDVSSTNFSITNPGITVTQPNGGETWTAGTYNYINWTSSGTSNYVKIEYSTDNGTTWTTISNASYNSGSYYWYVPSTASGQCLVKVSDYYTGTVFDISNATFTILLPPPTLTVTYPNGGQQFAVGSVQYLYWSSSNVSNVKIEYSSDGGSTWNTVIASTTNNGSYQWPVPNAPSSNCFIRVSDASNASISDVSDNPFSITAPYITVTYPNGGETFLIGNYYYIYWSSLGVARVNVDYSADGGTTWNVIATNALNYGYYGWSVPNNPSTNCKVRVTDANAATVTDISNSTFTIAAPTPTVNVYSPYGGETWYIGYQYYITWTSTGITNVKLEFSANGGSSWNTIISSTSASGGFYYWPVPNQPSANCLIRISDASNAAVNDVSGTFTIATPVPSITVYYPNGGETLYSGSYQYLSWSKNFVNAVNLYYSIDSGLVWNVIASNLTSTYYYWYVPSLTSNDCYIKVESTSNSALYDVSDAVFTIDLPPVNNNTITTDSVVPVPFCKQDTISVYYTATGTYNSGNVYTVQLSDSSGNFSYGIAIGSVASTLLTGNISCVIPSWVLNGSGYRIRVTASDWPVVGSDNGSDILINGPQFDFSADETIKYLPDGMVDFTYIGDTTNNVSYLWEFGDGSTSTLVNPSYFYPVIGFYDVSLTVEDVNGCSIVLNKPSYMRIEQLYPNDPLNTGTTQDVTSVSFSDYLTGCMGLADGNCAVTFDGGVTFTTLTTGMASASTSVTVVAGAWYITGYNGQIYVSTNQGQTWSPMYTGTTETFYGSAFTYASYGFSVGSNGIIYYYNGTNWVAQNSGVYYDLYNVTTWGNYAWAVGAYGTIVYYNGSNWAVQTTPVSTDIQSINVIDSVTAYAVAGNGYILTWDGLSWNIGLSGVDVDFSDVTAYGDSSWAVSNSGIVYYSNDRGSSWVRYSVGSTNDLTGITFKVTYGKSKPATRGYITGKGGDARIYNQEEGDTTISIRETLEAKAQMKIYPNPAVSSVTVETYLDNAERLKITMKDLHGKTVANLCNKTVKGSYSRTVDVSRYPNGVYFMHVEQGGKSWVQKINLQ